MKRIATRALLGLASFIMTACLLVYLARVMKDMAVHIWDGLDLPTLVQLHTHDFIILTLLTTGSAITGMVADRLARHPDIKSSVPRPVPPAGRPRELQEHDRAFFDDSGRTRLEEALK